MNDIQSLLRNFIIRHEPVFLVANGVVILCVILIVFAILIDFIKYHQPKGAKKKINSWVETGTMFLYFFGYYLLMHLKEGRFAIPSATGTNLLLILGTGLLITGCYVNILGRFVLKANWANQVTLYNDHTLVTQSVFSYVRHPLYASLIWMLIGGSLIYTNYFAFLSVLFIFIPMMYHRAKQEEALLSSEFPGYLVYKQRVGMFFPKIIKHGKL